MGTATSYSSQDFSSEVQNSATQNCPMSKCANEVTVNKLIISGARNRFNSKQRCVAESSCTFNQALDIATKRVTQNEASAEAGWAPSATDSTSVQRVRESIKNKVDQNCGTADARNKFKSEIVEFTADSSDNIVDIVQEGDSKASCELASMNKIVQDSQTENKGTSDATGGLVWILIIVAIMLVVGFSLYLIL